MPIHKMVSSARDYEEYKEQIYVAPVSYIEDSAVDYFTVNIDAHQTWGWTIDDYNTACSLAYLPQPR